MEYTIVFGIYDRGGHCAPTSVKCADEKMLAEELNYLMNRPRMKSGGFNGGSWKLTYNTEKSVFMVDFVPSPRA